MKLDQNSVLHSLESSEKMVGNAVQQAVSICKARRHVGMNYNLCGFMTSQSNMDVMVIFTSNVVCPYLVSDILT